MLQVAELRCVEVRRFLGDYLEGNLDVANAQRMRWHFGHCKECRMIVQSAIETFRANYREEPVSTPSDKRRAA
ncbi:MAG TPA: zf-HC2 domain-containing protein [Candidatus Acidoferrales bacterium]|jgi:predicted anti-sigma-YlaC factor YlaD|nr:zf-HC2 domain-containing protein [Candidatus Acidoferrales bacterium]